MRRALRCLVPLSVIILVRCSFDGLTGGGSDLPDKFVTGRIVNADNAPAANTQVALIPLDYNGVFNPPITAARMDTTDSSGTFCIQGCETGVYSVQAVHLVARTRLLVTGVVIAGGMTIIPADTLRNPGVVKINLPDSVDRTNGWLYIPGTMIAVKLSGTAGYAVIDSVPAGTIPSVWYVTTNDPVPAAIRYHFDVPSGDTAVLAKPAWKYSRTLYLNTTASGAQVAGNVVHVPVLVRLTGENFDFSQARSGGEDLRITKADTTALPYEIERWDPVTELAEVWVRVDTIRGNDSTQSIMMYWGNPNASNGWNGAAVFDTAAGFAGVWHLSQGCDDATGNRHDGATGCSTDTAGIIGYCKKFTHSDSIVIAGLLGAPQSLTLSAWAQLDSTPGIGGDIISIGDAAFIRMDYPANNIGTGGAVHLSDQDTVFAHVGSGKYLKQTGWHFITMTHSEATYVTTVYIDGVIAGIRTDLNKPINYNGLGQNTYIGKHGNGKTGFEFFGRIDEIRVYRTAISADWIKLSFMNQREDNRLIVFK
jgi:hypothetical protein